MKTLKSMFALLFLMSFAICQAAFAQTQKEEQTEFNSNEQVDEYSEYDVVDPYQQSVTLDENSETGTVTEEEVSIEAESKPAAKIHLYSGMHDGNNIINPDPK